MLWRTPGGLRLTHFAAPQILTDTDLKVSTLAFRKSTVYAIEAGDVQVMLHCSLGMDDGEYYLVVTPLLIPTDAARSTKGFGFFVSLKHRLRRFKLILDNHRWSGMPFSRPRSSPVRHHQPRSAHPNR